MSKGILLVACGEIVFKELAVTLALSIKYSNQDLPISLAGTSSCFEALTEKERNLFDELIPIPEADYFIKKVPHYGLLKTKLINYTPYQKTLFLDVDTIIFKGKDLNEIFEELEPYDFSCQTYPFFIRGVDVERQAWIIFWAPVKSVRKAFNITGNIAQVHSYLLYFDKEKALPLFQKAQEIYLKIINRKVYIDRLLRWRDGVPDELCFSIATALTGIFPHVGKYDRLAEPGYVNKMKFEDVEKTYIGFTMPGNGTETYLTTCKKHYSALKAFFYQNAGMVPQFKKIVK